MDFDTIAAFVERIIPWLSVLVVVASFCFAVLKWMFGERGEGKSRETKNNTDALTNLTRLVTELADDLVKSNTSHDEKVRKLEEREKALEKALEKEKADALDRAVDRAREHREETIRIRDEVAAASKIKIDTLTMTLKDLQNEMAENAKKIRALESNLQARTDEAKMLKKALQKRDEFIDFVLEKLNSYYARDGIAPLSAPN